MIALAALAASVSMLMPTWSPDGVRVAWAETENGTPAVLTANADGSDAASIARVDGLFQLQFVAPDRLLASANYRLYTLSTDGGLTPFANGGPTFGLDQQRTIVAWQAADACPFCHGPILVRALTDGSKAVRIGGSAQNLDPSLSPDRKSVVFIRNLKVAGRWEQPAGLWVSSTTGGPLRRLVRSGGCPAWSPDGTRIAYWTRDAIRTIAPAGGASSVLTRLRGSCPQWSPSGRKLAVIGPGARIYVVDAKTRKARAVTGPTQGQVSGFEWAPDSSRLLLTGRIAGANCYRLSVVAADGSGRRTLRGC
jgi:Tol biopolymer transport system component